MSLPRLSGKKLSFATLLLAGLISLHGCGGSRDEPFDPGDDDDDDNVDVVTVDFSLVESGSDARLATDDNKRLQVLREYAEFYEIYDQYSETTLPEDPDFERGQVVLIDAGVIDNSPCADKLVFSDIRAQEENGSVVKVIVEYEEQEPETDADCPTEFQATRPFRFYFIESREKLIFSEEIQ